MLEETVLDDFALEDESLENCVKAFNLAIRKAGVPPDKLRVVIDPRSREDLSQLRIRELTLHDATLADAMKFLCGNTKIYYRVAAGMVILGEASVTYETAEGDDPFASPGSPDREQPSHTRDSKDPFGP